MGAAVNRVNSNSTLRQKKMKPYKSNQTRRMPDNPMNSKSSTSVQYMDLATNSGMGARRDGSSYSEHGNSHGGSQSRF